MKKKQSSYKHLSVAERSTIALTTLLVHAKNKNIFPGFVDNNKKVFGLVPLGLDMERGTWSSIFVLSCRSRFDVDTYQIKSLHLQYITGFNPAPIFSIFCTEQRRYCYAGTYRRRRNLLEEEKKLSLLLFSHNDKTKLTARDTAVMEDRSIPRRLPFSTEITKIPSETRLFVTFNHGHQHLEYSYLNLALNFLGWSFFLIPCDIRGFSLTLRSWRACSS